ncbi:MAG TPA: hypothetical protein VGT98_06910, partial [Candidatus Elarobacter sp.]|nr:hypothetical protein [Candidatus Elarobacter sp.]
MTNALAHRHGRRTHEHSHAGPHRHLRLPARSIDEPTEPGVRHPDDGTEGRNNAASPADHGHTHGRIDPSIIRSHAGVKAVATSLAILGVTAALQAVVFALSGSVALLADLIHNGGDALTAIPLAVAFLARSERGERWAGYVVVLTIFVSAAVAAVESVDRLIHPHRLTYLAAVAAAGV